MPKHAAEPGEDEEDKFDDSSEESDDEDKYEADDFIVDDVEDDVDVDDHRAPRPMLDEDLEEEEEVDRSRKKKKKRHHHEDPDLVEDDLVLLEESGIRVNRTKRLKRLRKSAADDEVDDELAEDVRNLARDDVDDGYEETHRRADEPVDYDDDMDDFIDDGGRSSRRRAAERDGLVSSEAVRTARSIFGDIEEMSKYKGTGKLLRGEGDGDDEEDEDYREHGELPRPGGGIRKDRGDDDEPSDEEGEKQLGPAEAADQAESGAIAEGLSGPKHDMSEVERIVKTDIPEQLQYHFGPDYKPPDDEQIRDEANWVYRKGFLDNPKFNGDSRYQSGQIVQKIIVILSYVHIDKLDLPFIAMYRKDYVSSILIPTAGEYFRKNPTSSDAEKLEPMAPPHGFNSLEHEDHNPAISYDHLRGVPNGFDDGFGDWSILWLILDLDKKYADMTRRRNALTKSVDDAQTKAVPTAILNELRVLIDACDEERGLNDCERHLRLAVELADALNKDRIGDDFDDDNDRRSRRPSRRRNRYADFCKRGYRSLTKEFGISARQFGENLEGVSEHGVGSHVPIECDSEPIETAKLVAIRTGESTGESEDVGDKLAERVLAAARFILVTEIASDISVLRAARRILCRPGTVTVTTTPTPQGIAQVDDTHPLRCVTCLSEKKVETFRGTADFALIRRAEELGFTNMEIQFRDEQVENFVKHLKTSIIVESVSEMVALWNAERVKVVEDVHKLLIKTMMDEVREELEENTSFVLRYKLSNAASRRFLLGPARPNPRDDGCPRVLAFSVTSEEDEEADPLQTAKDEDDAKDRKDGSERRVAPERITVVDMDENGEYSGGYELFASWLRRPMHPDNPDAQLSRDVKDQLKTFILKSKAAAIVIGIGSGRRAPVRLKSDLMEVVKEMVKEKTEARDESLRPAFLTDIDVRDIREAQNHEEVEKVLSKYIVLCDDSSCRVYAKTNWSMAGLSVDAMTLLEKRTIALARLAQEPLWVYTAIGQEKDLAVRLQFHPYHYYAKPADRLIALRRALIRAVCTTGIDVNRSLRLPHTQSMVPFLGGLGIHKGKALMKELGNILSDGERGLVSRKHLWSHSYIGKTVFLSTAAFLRVRDPELHPGGSTKLAVEIRRQRLGRKTRGRRHDDMVYDPMDDSRIHPEHYAVAFKIADEALRDDHGRLCVDIPDSDEYSESIRMTAAVLDDPNGLKRLALDEYALHLETLGRGSLFETVKMIASEFQGPYRDHRQELVSPEAKALFYIVTGADPILLRPGSAVTGTNCQVRTSWKNSNTISGISCFLPDGIRGFIPPQHFSDKELDANDVKKLVPLYSSCACRIMDFNYQRFEATLSSKVSILEDPALVSGYVPIIDKTDVAFRPYPKKEQANGLKSIRSGIAERGRSRDEQRKKTMSALSSTGIGVIQHPYFKNMPGEQAINVLRTSLPGDILIRPSQYRQNEIVFSCKFGNFKNMEDNRSILHIPCRVIEEGEEGDGNKTCRYKIEGNTYQQVDQALEEYVRPISMNMSEAIDNRKFREGTIEELKEYVLKEKNDNPKRIPYLFGLSEKRPACLVLMFIPGSKSVEMEEIQVIPNGYRFRSTLYLNIDKLIMWFKRNMTKSSASRRPVASARDTAGYQSPYVGAASPFRPTASPFPQQQPPPAVVPLPGLAQAQSLRAEYPARGAATPVKDVEPPPAPGVPMPGSNPYGYPPTAGGGEFGAGGGHMPRSGPTDWSKGRPVDDAPPPHSIQNGGGHHPSRPPPQRHAPYDRGAPPGRGDRGGGRDGPSNDKDAAVMPSWRGQKPQPAWKKAEGQH